MEDLLQKKLSEMENKKVSSTLKNRSYIRKKIDDFIYDNLTKRNLNIEWIEKISQINSYTQEIKKNSEMEEMAKASILYYVLGSN